MRVSDVMETSDFHIETSVPGPPGALERLFTWSIPTESMDPTPFLAPSSLVLTQGVALNVTDARVWDAYVERLVSVSVAALVFGIGPAHRTLPEALKKSCEDHGLPLLMVPAEVPFALVQRELQDRVTAERYEMIRKGSELAQECTAMVARGGTLQDLLQRISEVLGRRVALEDRTGTELLRAGSPGYITERTEFTLPGPEDDSFRLVAEVPTSSHTIGSLLRPATAVVAMQLNATLGSTALTFSRNAGRLVDAIFSRKAIPTDELLSLTRDAELDPYRPIGVTLIEVDQNVSITYLRTISWRVRTRLATEFPTMRFVEDPSLSTLLVQGRQLDRKRLRTIVAEAVGRAASVSCLVEVVDNSAELGLALRHIHRSLGNPGVAQAPAMNFDAVVDTLYHPGTVSMARRLLEPLSGVEYEPLRETLRTYLKLSGVKPAICEALFIHRNTLSYRLRKIEELLGLDLQDGQTRATLLLATRLVKE